MNKKRRKMIQDIHDKLMDIQTDLETINTEETEAYENLPISFQDGDKGEKMQEAIDNLDSAVGYISDAMSSLEDSIQ